MSDQIISDNSSAAVLEEVRQRLINVEVKLNLLTQRNVRFTPDMLASLGAHPDQHFGCKTFAQHGDDLVLMNIFNSLGIEKPSYLDIGAHHPFNISNTALFYLRGSRGVNVEANPNLIQAFVTQRPDDINLNVGVAGSPGTMSFYMLDQHSGLNTFDGARAAELKAMGFEVRDVIEVDVVTVPQIIEEYCGGVFPDLLSLDIEGLDLIALRSIQYDVAKPKVIVVECNDGESRTQITQLLESKEYFLYFRAVVNLFFVHNDYRSTIFAERQIVGT